MGKSGEFDPAYWDREEEYALLVDAVRDYALFQLSPEGVIRTWNSGASRIMGYAAEEVVGRHFSLFYPDTDRENRKPDRELEIAREEGRLEDEGWRIRKDGTTFWANTVITPLRETDGSIHGYAKVTRDLTERRASEESLRRSEEMFRLLVASVRDYAIFMLDPDGYVMSWNEGAERIKGYSADEVIGQHYSLFYTPEDRAIEKPKWMLETAEREGQVEAEGWRVRKDGRYFVANVLLTAVHDAQGELRGFAKVTRDITERRRSDELKQALLEQREARIRAEERRRLAEASSKAAQEASRAKDEFLMMLSHELRTPLTSILGWARLLPSLDRQDEAVGDGLQAIARSAEIQARLIDDVLDISRIVAGKLRLDLQSVDLVPVIEQACGHLRDLAENKLVKLAIEVQHDLGTGQFDPLRLQQIIWNLLSNAIKFSPEGGLVTVRAGKLGDRLQLEVEDQGDGISEDLLSRIFEPFTQAEMGISRSHGGLGLGLTIVRHLVEAHGGRIEAESEGLGHGALFRVHLPIRSDSKPRAEQTVGAPSQLTDQLSGSRILVVDDDAEARRLMISILTHAGAAVAEADSVSAALMHCGQAMPDLILTDIGMPQVNGYDLLARIRELETGQSVPIVAISAFDRGSQKADQFDAFLAKPIDPFELVATLRSILDRG